MDFPVTCAIVFVKLCLLSTPVYSLNPLVRLGVQVQGVQYHPPNTPWPNPEILKTMPFDYTIHDPKYDDISSVYNPGYKPEGGGSFKLSHTRTMEINRSFELS